MPDNVIQFPVADGPDADYWGDCPVCHRYSTFRNVGKVHWCCCDVHKTCWCVGINLFSNWLHETEDTWQENRRVLSRYRVVEPYGDGFAG